jgi:hypothetical protein
VAVSEVGNGALGRLLVIGFGMGRRDVKVKCGLLPLLTASIWLFEHTNVVLSSLYCDEALLWNSRLGLLGAEGEEGLVCPAKTGLLATADGAQGWLLSHHSISLANICSGCCLAMGMGKS